jgi:hypothetical protein
MQESDADFSKATPCAKIQPPTLPIDGQSLSRHLRHDRQTEVQFMKKLLAIVCLLLLLAAFIGVERINRNSRRDPAEAKTNVMRADKPHEARKHRTRPDKTATSPSTPTDSATTDGGVPMDAIERVAPKPAFIKGGTASGHGIKTLHYIRSGTILGAGKLDEASHARLLKAVKQAASANNAGMVVDIDGLTTSQVPVLVSASPRFDLTKEVEAVYRALARENPVTEVGKADRMR